MSRRPRRNHTATFKAKVVFHPNEQARRGPGLAAIKGEKTLIELAQEFDVHTNPGPGPALFAGLGGSRSRSGRANCWRVRSASSAAKRRPRLRRSISSHSTPRSAS